MRKLSFLIFYIVYVWCKFLLLTNILRHAPDGNTHIWNIKVYSDIDPLTVTILKKYNIREQQRKDSRRPQKKPTGILQRLVFTCKAVHGHWVIVFFRCFVFMGEEGGLGF